MSSGKTGIGRRLAESTGRPLLDGDEILEERTGGRTAAEIADAHGIDALHEMEAEIALEALSSTTSAVIGPAASVVEVDAVRRAMSGHLVVWLDASAEYLAERAVKKDHRPLVGDGDPVELFTHQIAARRPLVIDLAALVLDVEATSRAEQTEAVLALLAERQVL